MSKHDRPILSVEDNPMNVDLARRERPLHVLFLESDSTDIDLMRCHFASHAPHIHLEIVHSLAEEFNRFPGGGAPVEYDALMLDCPSRDLNVLDMLKELRQIRGLDLPIVLLSGHGDEDVAAQALRFGADDYVVKSPGYLFRLPGLLENAYHRAQLLREQSVLSLSEKRFQRLMENAPDIFYRYRVGESPQLEYISPAVTTVLGYTADELYADPDLVFETVHSDDRSAFQDMLQSNFPSKAPMTFCFVRKGGDPIWLEMRSVPVFHANGKVQAIEGVARDISERRTAEEHIQRQLQRLNSLRTVDTAISASLDLRVTLNLLIEHVVTQLNVHAAAMCLLNPHTQMLEYSAGKGFRSNAVEKVRSRLGENHAGRAALERRTIHAPEGDIPGGKNIFSDLLSGESFVEYYGTPLIAKGQVKGVLEVYHRRPLYTDQEWLSFFETLAGQAAIAIDNAELFENLQRANLELTLAYDTTLEGWVRALDLRDKETQGHTQRVTNLTIQLSRVMGVDEVSLRYIRRGALLHDIGKMGIPDSILHKPGPLSDEEWEIMYKHPLYAYDLLSPIEYLRRSLDIPYCHHEKWDGSGYPRGLQGEQIPQAARIFAVVDVWDALCSDRPYRKRWERDKAMEYIHEQRGKHFDPEVVDVFFQLIQTDTEY